MGFQIPEAGDDRIDEMRVTSRKNWEAQALAWERQRAWFQAATQAVSVKMIDEVSPQPGQVVLELAAGLGDTGLLAADLVHPGGKVILADGAKAMVEAAQRNAEDQKIFNVETAEMELEWIDMATASVDAILVRFGYMLVPDPEAGLRDARRVLKPGGRIAIAVWADLEDNPYFEITLKTLAEHKLIPRAIPIGEPGPFALADDVELREIFNAAGFIDTKIETVPVHFEAATVEETLDHIFDLMGTAKRAFEAQDEQVQATVRAAMAEKIETYKVGEGSNQKIVIPGATFVVSADA